MIKCRKSDMADSKFEILIPIKQDMASQCDIQFIVGKEAGKKPISSWNHVPSNQCISRSAKIPRPLRFRYVQFRGESHVLTCKNKNKNIIYYDNILILLKKN